MATTKPKIYAHCKAGCEWETIHKEEFLNSIPLLEISRDETGKNYYCDFKKKYKVNVNQLKTNLTKVYIHFITKGNNSSVQTFDNSFKLSDLVDASNYDAYTEEFTFEPIEVYTDFSGGSVNITHFVFRIDGVLVDKTLSLSKPYYYHHSDYDDELKIYITDNQSTWTNIIGVYSVNYDAEFVVPPDLVVNIDDTLSEQSTNPVQNKVITEALNNKVGASVEWNSEDFIMLSAYDKEIYASDVVINDVQLKKDNSLNTYSKSVVGAINENEKRIENIEYALKGTTINTSEVSSVAYQVANPTNVLPYALINKVGGMTYQVDSALQYTSPTKVISKSKNLFVLNDVGSTTINGITYKIENGVITLNGTSTARVYAKIKDIELNPGTYYIYDFLANANYYVYFNNKELSYSHNRSITIENHGTYALAIFVESGTTLNNIILKPMLVIGSTAPTEFEQGTSEDYFNDKIIAIKNHLISLGYDSDILGYGVDSTYYNYIDFDNKKVVINCKKVELKSSDFVNIQSNSTIARTDYLNKYCSREGYWNSFVNVNSYGYIATSVGSLTSASGLNIAINNNASNLNGAILVKNSEGNIESEIAKYDTNPLIVVFRYYEPIEIDISSILDNDNYIKVEQGGSIIYENSNAKDIPSVATYQTKVS